MLSNTSCRMEPDHHPIILSQTEYGRIFTCTCCRTVYIEFGNFMLQLLPRAFVDFSQIMVRTPVDALIQLPEHIDIRRPYLLRINDNHVQMRFSDEEYEAFQTLIAAVCPNKFVVATHEVAGLRN